MKRKLACFLAALALLATAGCAGKSAAVSMDVGKTADSIVKTVKFSDQMSAVDQKTAEKLFGLDSGSVASVKAYESTGATAEEVAAFEAKDEASEKQIAAAVKKRVENQKAAFQDYQPKEMTKLQNPLIVEKGNYVFLCIADDTAPARQTIDQAAK